MLCKTLTLNLDKIYFEQIKNRTKSFEYRLDCEYWRKRILGKEFDCIVFKCGYPKNTDRDKIFVREWRGYKMEMITHEKFGALSEDKKVRVISIDATGRDVF